MMVIMDHQIVLVVQDSQYNIMLLDVKSDCYGVFLSTAGWTSGYFDSVSEYKAFLEEQGLECIRVMNNEED